MGKLCFVIMPFSQTTFKRTTDYWDHFFSDFITPMIESLGYECRRSQASSTNIVSELVKDLRYAELVIAVLTDMNPNVWYELGIRHASKRGTIMMIEKGQSTPFDVSTFGTLRYVDSGDPSNLALVKDQLSFFIDKLSSSETPDNPVMEFEWIAGESVRTALSEKVIKIEERIEDIRKQTEERVDKAWESRLAEMVKIVLEQTNYARVTTASPASGVNEVSTKRVLWVDDYPANDEAWIVLLKAQGVVTDIAVSTEQALANLSKHDSDYYSLIVSDMDRGHDQNAGIDLLDQLKSTQLSRVPVIIYSSFNSIERSNAKAEELGAYLITSSPHQFYDAVAELLGLPKPHIFS